MDPRLKDKLPQITLESLHKFDQGRLNRQFARAIARILDNISEFPCRDGKPESREVSIKLTVTPQIRKVKKPVETAYGHNEIEVPEIFGLMISAMIKDKLPIFKSGDVVCAVDVRNGRITDARFNPANSLAPEQMELFDDEPALADSPDDDDDDDDDSE